jgi:hypothetical protein
MLCVVDLFAQVSAPLCLRVSGGGYILKFIGPSRFGAGIVDWSAHWRPRFDDDLESDGDCQAA